MATSGNDIILLSHGGGGKLAHQLIAEEFLPVLGDAELSQLGDAALVAGAEKLAFTTDGFVVKPIFFPGGDIGRLAVSGTVNDLAVSGAIPLYISLSMIIEEGFRIEDLRRIVRSVKSTADEAGVRVVCGDTKVVERGGADGMFITTSGIGRAGSVRLGPGKICVGDAVIVSGTLGDHAIAVMSVREGIEFRTQVSSDVQPLNDLIQRLMAGADVHAMRDPTRGGAAAVLNELADAARVCVELSEAAIPVASAVQGACDVLGLDPLYAANEGKVIAFVSSESAQPALESFRSHPKGGSAAIIGRVTEAGRGRVTLRTRLGGARLVDMPMGEQLPRIC